MNGEVWLGVLDQGRSLRTRQGLNWWLCSAGLRDGRMELLAILPHDARHYVEIRPVETWRSEGRAFKHARLTRVRGRRGLPRVPSLLCGNKAVPNVQHTGSLV